MKKYYLIIGFLIALATTLLAIDVAWAEDKLPAEAKACLESKIGSVAFSEILTGAREATEAEKKLGEGCFSGVFKKNKSAQVPTDVKACIKQAIGKELSELEGAPTTEQQTKIESCFGGATKGAFAFPSETKACIKQALGEARANEFMNGQKPTEAEKNAIGPKCFGMKGGGGNRPEMPAEAKACFVATFGKTPEAMGSLTEAQRKTMDEKCFGAKERERAREGAANMSAEQRACFTRVIGKSLEEAGALTADQEKTVGEQCFAPNQSRQSAGAQPSDQSRPNQAQSGGSLDSSSGQSVQSEQGQQTCSENPFSQYKIATQQCIADGLSLTIATLCRGNYNDPSVEAVVATCKTNNAEDN